MCALLGISIPMQCILAADRFSENYSSANFNGNVLIVGAGAAGLTAGYLLNQHGIDFKILEASSKLGGRMKINSDFVDFPIPLGAEWLHSEKSILGEIVNDSSVNIETETKPYDSNNDYGLYEGYKVSLKSLGFRIDQKFIGSSWLGFFEEYVVPSVEDKLEYNVIVESIDYSGKNVTVKTSHNDYIADTVILTVPIKILQNQSISFTPSLPDYKLKAINNVTVWDGFKAFIEFEEKFYPAAIGYKVKPRRAGQKLYYDAAYGQHTESHVLGLFTVGSGTLPYRNLPDDKLIKYMLNELDELFDGKASLNYVKHISQNWSAEPFINSAYVYDHENWLRMKALGKPVNDKLLFAGTDYTDGDDWGSVHTAARSAIKAVEQILE